MTVMESAHFDVEFSENNTFSIAFQEEEPFSVNFGPTIEKEYHGAYSVTPAPETQTLHTTNKVLVEDITIEPIPNNYGLITWNGSELTVS